VLAQQRRRIIVSALERGPFVGLHDAVELTGASEATVRRDFAALEADGLVQRHHGGVERLEYVRDEDARSAPLVSQSLESRLAVREEAKRLIAERASRMCVDGQTVFVDAGSTALGLAHRLARMSIRIITNSFAAARDVLADGVAEVILTGGQIDRSSNVVFSYVDDAIIDSYPPDIAFLGAQGVDASGFYNSDERLIRLERRVARIASQIVLIADSSKFGERGRIRVGDLADLDAIVTDAGVSEEFATIVGNAGVKLIAVR
jgi:DeoR family ulaG and ulaABCDEF operon transcriptional repressor